jgi:hypothetical protein
MKKWKRFVIALTAAITVPIMYIYGPGTEPVGVNKLTDFAMTGDFQIIGGIRDSVDTTRLLLPLDSLINDSVQAYTPGAGDMYLRMSTDSGKNYKFSVKLISGGATSNIQFYDGCSTFIFMDSLAPGVIEKEFVAPTSYLQISLSYGPSAWANAFIEKEDTTE